jgi:hypothetical protein
MDANLKLVLVLTFFKSNVVPRGSLASTHELKKVGTRVRRFRKKNFFASKRNKAKRDPFRMRFARSREKNKFFFASFRFEFCVYFRFVSLTKIFRFASDLFVSLQSETK